MSVTHIMATRDTSLIPKRRAERKVTVLLDAHLCSEVQELCTREFLAHRNLAAQVKPNQMKDALSEIDAIVCRSMGRLLRSPLIPRLLLGKAADHFISNPVWRKRL